MSAFPNDPLIRGAIMQSGDSESPSVHFVQYLTVELANQPMWPLNDQISKIATDLGCPTGKGELECLRTKSGDELRQSLLSTRTQFQPVTDNITIFKESAPSPFPMTPSSFAVIF